MLARSEVINALRYRDDIMEIIPKEYSIFEVVRIFQDECKTEYELLNMDIDALEFVLEQEKNVLTMALMYVDDVTYYEVDNFKELAEILVEDGVYGAIDSFLEYYIDYSFLGNDIRTGGSYIQRGDNIFYAYYK